MTMIEQAGHGNQHPQVVVLTGSALRSAPLELMANALRARGATVEIVTGVDRRRVDLLKLSFRHRDRACYLLCGGPALQANVLESIALELEANGVPAHRISSAPCPWDEQEAMARQALDRLAAMGIDLEAPGPTPPVPNLPPVRQPLPSRTVPSLATPTPGAADEVPVRRVPHLAWAAAAIVGLGVIGFGAVSLASTDASAEDVDEPEVTRAASVASPDDAEPADAAVPELDAAVPELDAAVEPDLDVEVDDKEDTAEAHVDAPDSAEPPPEAPTPGDDAALVYAALRSQSIRAIDILLVSPPAMRKRGRRQRVAKLNFEAARTHCDELNVDGVVGWRLPEIGEAQWLSRSNLINSGIYWTATKADAFGGERVTWNPRAKRMRATNHRWRGGRTVCVRFHNGADPGPE